MKPPFHAEHIGSFVRPQRLIEAARSHKAGKLDDAWSLGARSAVTRREFAEIDSAGVRPAGPLVGVPLEQAATTTRTPVAARSSRSTGLIAAESRHSGPSTRSK